MRSALFLRPAPKARPFRLGQRTDEQMVRPAREGRFAATSVPGRRPAQNDHTEAKARAFVSVEIQRSAMTAILGAGIGVGVCTQTNGWGCFPYRADQVIERPGKAAMSAQEYWARRTFAIEVPAAEHSVSA